MLIWQANYRWYTPSCLCRSKAYLIKSVLDLKCVVLHLPYFYAVCFWRKSIKQKVIVRDGYRAVLEWYRLATEWQQSPQNLQQTATNVAVGMQVNETNITTSMIVYGNLWSPSVAIYLLWHQSSIT